MKLEKIEKGELINFVKREVETFNQCFRCGACSGICPVKKTTQVFDPRKIIYLLMLGFIDKLINEILWYCSQCGSCVPVCPMEVKPKDVIKSLRDFALEKNLVSEDKLFEIGVFARVNPEKCVVCLTCVRTCPFSAASIKDIGYAYIDPKKCKACGICVRECPASAIELKLKPEYLEIRS